MKKEEINSELISKIKIKVEDTLFYMPGETIKGKIIINPKYKMKDKVFHLTLKLIQYEFWEYNNKEIEELKNIYKTVTQEENLEYKLNEMLLELSKGKSSNSFENFSIIEKEEENKIISIPFEFKIKADKLLPTFQFQNKDYILGIRHLLIAECEEFNSSNYTGLFIGKNQNTELSEPKEIKESYMVGLGSLEIITNYPKLSYKTDEEIILNIETKADLNFKKVTEVEETFYRKINWVGYLKNSNLDRKIYGERSFKYNENKYGSLERLTMPIKPVIDSLCGAALGIGGGIFLFSGGFLDTVESIRGGVGRGVSFLGGAIGAAIGGIFFAPIGFVVGFFTGLFNQGSVLQDCLNLNYNEKNMQNDFKEKIYLNEEQKSLLIEELKKFVFFKDNKVAGFIKFGQDITPPVNGYYFNCEYNMKIQVEIAGIVLNRNKYLKTQIDLYDSDEYIAKMKKIFKTN